MIGKLVYLDNAAHAPLFPEVGAILLQYSGGDFGNPASLHQWGYRSHEALKKARQWFADFFDVAAPQVIFTGGGTEADHLAILGVLRRKPLTKQHAITTSIEHAAVFKLFKKLEMEGLPVSYLPVSQEGILSPDIVQLALRPETTLVSVIGVNNEVGTIQPLSEIGAILKRENPKTLFHVDGVQAFGKIPISLHRHHIDLLTLSGHKIHGPSGVGALILAKPIPLIPIFSGGDQEHGFRSGTENLPGIMGFYEAAKRLTGDSEKYFLHVQKLMILCRNGLDKFYPHIVIHSSQGASPYLLSFSVKNLPSEVGVRLYSDNGIAVSSGSACHSSQKNPNRILKALGVSDASARSSIRVSLSPFTEEEEILLFLEATKKVLDFIKHSEVSR